MRAINSQNISHGEAQFTEYRPDIDGLRALAIVSVIVYHAFPTLLESGFVGVDIFFVISGYLITANIKNGLDRKQFSFREFYIRRINRLLPALSLVLAVSYLTGWLTLFPFEFKELSQHIVAVARSDYNILLYRTLDYFNPAAPTKPLLHLWSLAVEAQFYLVWPLLLWVAFKAGQARWLTLLLLATSFYMCMEWDYTKPTMSFYLPHVRMWELWCGSVVALSKSDLANKRHFADPLATAGVLLLIAGFYTIHTDKMWPNALTLFPVLGTACLIAAGDKAWVNNKALSLCPVVGLGLISYPLYLWHWPILSFARVIHSDLLDLTTRCVCVFVAIVCAMATYRYLEVPLRKVPNRPKAVALIMLLAGIYAAGIATELGEGLPLRAVVKNNEYTEQGKSGGDLGMAINGCGVASYLIDNFSVCSSDKRGGIRYALVGDSKAAVLFPGLVRTSTDKGRWLVISGYGYNAPLPVLTDNPLFRRYQARASVAIDAVKENPAIKVVVLAVSTRMLFDLKSDNSIEDLPQNGNFDLALEGLSNTVSLLKKADKKVVLFADNPTLPSPMDCLARSTEVTLLNDLLVKENPKCMLTLKKHMRLSDKYRQLLRAVQERFPDDVAIYDPIAHLCNLKAETCGHRLNGKVLYGRSDHISDYVAGVIGMDINALLEKY